MGIAMFRTCCWIPKQPKNPYVFYFSTKKINHFLHRSLQHRFQSRRFVRVLVNILMEKKLYYRRASHAGSWYEARKERLRGQLQSWLAAPSDTEIPAGCRAIIVPHAGYSYSGATAAFSYKAVAAAANSVRRIFVLGPSHHVYLQKASVSGAGRLETPLGDLVVDAEVRAKLVDSGLFETLTEEMDEEEHSIELHLPYIAEVMAPGSPAFEQLTVVPIMIGNLDSSSAKRYASVLAPYFNEPNNVFVVSSDFCHWGARFQFMPFDETKGADIHNYIEWLDKRGMALIEAQDRQGFSAYIRETENTICGRNPIILLLAILEQSNKPLDVRFVKYAQSSPAKTRNDSSVSYASAIVSERKCS
jgi:AmmeMemoRadiSam system protein B